MENQLFNHIVSLEDSILVRELGQIMGSLGVIGGEGLDDLLFLLFGCQLFLVNAIQLVILVHVEEISVIVHVLATVFLLNDILHLLLIGQLYLL